VFATLARGLIIAWLDPVLSSVRSWEARDEEPRLGLGAKAKMAAMLCALRHIYTAYQNKMNAVGMRKNGVTKKIAAAMKQMMKTPLTIIRVVV